MRVGIAGDDFREDVHAQGFGDAQAQAAALETEVAVDFDKGLLDVLQNFYGLAVEDSADLGEGRVAAAASKEFDAKFFFELLNLDGDGGLADAEFLGGPRVAAPSSHGLEHLNLTERVHGVGSNRYIGVGRRFDGYYARVL